MKLFYEEIIKPITLVAVLTAIGFLVFGVPGAIGGLVLGLIMTLGI